MMFSLPHQQLSFVFCLVLAFFPAASLQADQFVFHHENVLGTSLELTVVAGSRADAEKVEAEALKQIDHLNQIFSTYSKSELLVFSKLAKGETATVSDELHQLLISSLAWTEKSGGAFNPAAQAYAELWQKAEKAGKVPTAEQLKTVSALVNSAAYTQVDESQEWTRSSTAPLSFNAIAKGTIMDRVAADLIERQKLATGVSINIGGDIRVVGDLQLPVSIANPANDRINGGAIASVEISNGAVATSGISERKLEIGGKSFSHIIDGRSGLPVQNVVSATVVASRAETADVLATICSILPIKESLKLVDSVEGASCLLVESSGKQHTSANWTGQIAEAITTKVAHDFQVEFEIANSEGGRRYRRPYVAVWVEDEDDFPVKTLSLFLMTRNPGPRWHRDLRRWYSANQMRRLVDDTDLIGTISKPTRNPGQYKVSWDGTDDSGEALPKGNYTLYIEAAREHGTYQLMKYPFQLGGDAFNKELKPNAEISAATFSCSKE